MRRVLVAIAAAASVFAATAAGAASFTLTNASGQGGTYKINTTSNTVNVTSAVCQDTFDIAYTYSAGQITAVTLTDTASAITSGCQGAGFSVSLGTSTFSGTLSYTPGTGSSNLKSAGASNSGTSTSGGPYTLTDGTVTAQVTITPA